MNLHDDDNAPDSFWHKFILALAMGAMIATLGALLLVKRVEAADLRPDTTVVAPRGAAVDWSGPYAGVSVGYGVGSVSYNGLIQGTLDGVAAAGIIGWNGHIGGLVAGVEGDVAWSGIKGSISDLAFGSDLHITTKGTWLGSARLRLGVPIHASLLYGTAGLAMTHVEVQPSGVNKAGRDLVGVAFGVGIEHMLTNTVALRLEAMNYQFGTKRLVIGGEPATVSTTDTVVRTGFTIKLN